MLYSREGGLGGERRTRAVLRPVPRTHAPRMFRLGCGCGSGDRLRLIRLRALLSLASLEHLTALLPPRDSLSASIQHPSALHLPDGCSRSSRSVDPGQRRSRGLGGPLDRSSPSPPASEEPARLPAKGSLPHLRGRQTSEPYRPPGRAHRAGLDQPALVAARSTGCREGNRPVPRRHRRRSE